jgi:hypothetical protein
MDSGSGVRPWAAFYVHMALNKIQICAISITRKYKRRSGNLIFSYNILFIADQIYRSGCPLQTPPTPTHTSESEFSASMVDQYTFCKTGAPNFGLANPGFNFGLSEPVFGCTRACVTCVSRAARLLVLLLTRRQNPMRTSSRRLG